MVLETKQVVFRAHVHSLDRRSRNAHDHFEQTLQFCFHRTVHKEIFLNSLVTLIHFDRMQEQDRHDNFRQNNQADLEFFADLAKNIQASILVKHT